MFSQFKWENLRRRIIRWMTAFFSSIHSLMSIFMFLKIEVWTYRHLTEWEVKLTCLPRLVNKKEQQHFQTSNVFLIWTEFKILSAMKFCGTAKSCDVCKPEEIENIWLFDVHMAIRLKLDYDVIDSIRESARWKIFGCRELICFHNFCQCETKESSFVKTGCPKVNDTPDILRPKWKLLNESLTAFSNKNNSQNKFRNCLKFVSNVYFETPSRFQIFQLNPSTSLVTFKNILVTTLKLRMIHLVCLACN